MNKSRECWAFAREVERDEHGKIIWGWWTGDHSDSGKSNTSRDRIDAFKFPNATEALRCAETHSDLRESEQWHLKRIFDHTAPQTSQAFMRRLGHLV